MSEALVDCRCESCNEKAKPLDARDQEALLAQLPGWRIAEEQGVPVLIRSYDAPDFATLLPWTVKLGALSEKEGHHPRLLLEHGRLTVSWWTHVIRGLHKNDFIMAAKTDHVVLGPKPG